MTPVLDSGFPEVTPRCADATFTPVSVRYDTIKQATMQAPWVVVEKWVVHRELGIVITPTRDIYSSHRPRNPQDLCEALNRAYSTPPGPGSTPPSADAPAQPPGSEPPSPA